MFLRHPNSPRSAGVAIAVALLAILPLAAVDATHAHASTATHADAATRRPGQSEGSPVRDQRRRHAGRGNAHGRSGGVTARTATALPPQGLYEECAPSDQAQCAGELSQMAGAGFHLALNYTAWSGDAAQIVAYANEAEADGIKIIWPLDYSAWRDPGSDSTLPQEYSDLAPDCGCTTNTTFAAYVIGLVKSLPATWGYYIGDELDPSQAPATTQLAQTVRSLDPGHPLLYIGMGGAQTASNLRPFETIGGTIGADVYPIGQGAPVSYVGTVASTVEHLSATFDTRPAMVLQAFDWSEYPGEVPTVDPTFPTQGQMLQMRDLALAHRPSMILWYSLKEILATDNPAGNWRALVSAAFAPVPRALP
jgi:hypothetical protein